MKLSRLVHAGLLSLPLLLPALLPENASAFDDLYQEPYRPQLHFSPQQQWMNDPNGMVYYEGEYHLFYQYHPYSNVWGPMHWGHAVSKDMVTWEELPVALWPDEQGTIFSGSAVIDWNNTTGFGSVDNPPMVAIYTYHNHAGENMGRVDFQSQAIAYSLDKGRSWSKYKNNPVLANPGEFAFRDPKVFWHEGSGQWIMSLAVADTIHFYSSPNLKEWQFESKFGEGLGVHAGVWECPDLIELPVENGTGSRYVLLVSIGEGGPNGGSATQYFVGDFDGKRFTLDPDIKSVVATRPLKFPAGQVFEDFERGLDNWTQTGDAFAVAPVTPRHAGDADLGKQMLASFVGGDRATGSMLSKPFKIKRPYINFYTGGWSEVEGAAVSLLVDGKVVRTAGGSSYSRLNASSWDVKDLRGKEAQIRIEDNASGPRGVISVDSIVFANKPAQPRVESGLWIDHGTDNYAGVTWSDVPEADGRTLFIGWMSNWDYATRVPTQRWRSAMTLPRAMHLRQTGTGPRLFSRPVAELEDLRAGSSSIENVAVNGSLDLADKLELSAKQPLDLQELTLDLSLQQAQLVTLEWSNTLDERVTFSIDRANGQYVLDRTRAGKSDFADGFAARQVAPITGSGDQVSLRVYLDRSSIEVFANDGETIFTALLFPNEAYGSLRLVSDKAVQLRSATAYSLQSIWSAARN